MYRLGLAHSLHVFKKKFMCVLLYDIHFHNNNNNNNTRPDVTSSIKPTMSKQFRHSSVSDEVLRYVKDPTKRSM